MTDQQKVVSIPSIDVLMNRGFRVTVNKVKKVDGVWARVDGEEEVIHIAFNNWHMAEIEVYYGALDSWNEAFQVKTFHTTAETLAIVEGVFTEGDKPDARYGAMRLKDGRLSEYVIALQNAALLAQGVSPEVVGEAVEMALRQQTKEINRMEKEVLAEIHNLVEDDEGDTPTSPSNFQESASTSQTGHGSSDPSMSIGN